MKHLLKNASYLFISNVVVRLITAFAAIVVARYLGVADYGLLSLAIAVTTVAAYFTDMGLSNTFIREATKEDKEDLKVLVGSHFKIRFVFVGIVGAILLFFTETFYSDDNFLKKTIYFMAFPTIIGATLQGVGVAYFQAIQQMHFIAYIRILSGVVTSSTLFLGLLFKWPLLLLATMYGFSSFIGGFYSTYLLSRRTPLLVGWNRKLLDGLWSFTFGGLLVMLLPQIPPIILEKVSSIQEVGYFSAAYRIPSVLYQVPGIIAAAFYPLLFKYGSSNQKLKHLEISITQTKMMTMLGGVMVLPFFLYSEWWINLIFGSGWDNISSLLSVVSLVVLLQSINYPLADSLTTRGLQSKRTLVMFLSIILAICCYYYFGGKYGSLGAAVTVITTEVFLLIGFVFFNNGLSKQILKKGTFNNLLSFCLTIFIAYFIKMYLHPLFGSVFFVFLFLGLAVYFDNLIRKQLLTYLKRRFGK